MTFTCNACPERLEGCTLDVPGWTDADDMPGCPWCNFAAFEYAGMSGDGAQLELEGMI